MAMDLIAKGRNGLMMAINQRLLRRRADSRSETRGRGSVDVEKMYDTERYRPSYTNKIGLPIFLTRA